MSCRLDEKSLACLRDPRGMIDDAIINYFLTRIAAAFRGKDFRVVAVDTSVSLLLGNSMKDDDAVAIGSHLTVPKGNGVLLVPIWNKLHWSLLAFHTAPKRFYHADSLDMNRSEAIAISQRIVDRVKDKCSLRHYPKVEQVNEYDCGLFVIANAEEIVKAIATGGKFVPVDNVRGVRRQCLKMANEDEMHRK